MGLGIKGGKTTQFKDKKPKKQQVELSEEDIAFKNKQKADEKAKLAYLTSIKK